jgi:hypothetical protein
VYASWHTPECEGKSAANEFKAFLFWRVREREYARCIIQNAMCVYMQ